MRYGARIHTLKTMTIRRRRILFLLTTGLFLLLVVPVLLYSFGYRFSTETWRIVHAGGLSVSSTPSTGTRIYVDGKLVKETTLLSRKLFLQGLTPHAYKIRIEKEGYFSWEKTLPVRPERVTDVQALLVRDGPDGAVILQGDWKKLSFLPGSETIVKLSDSKNNNRFFSLTDIKFIPNPLLTSTSTPTLPEEVKKILAEKKPIGYDYDFQGERMLWWNEHSLSIHWLRGEEFLPLYTEKTEEKIFQSSDSIREAKFYPGQDAVLLTFSNAVVIIELDGRGNRNVYPLYKGNRPDFLVSNENNKIYVLDGGNLIVIPIL